MKPPVKRILSDHEIRTFWHGLVSLKNPSTQIGFKLLLVTAQRRGELASARWADIDFSEGSWRIPQDNSKNRRGHNVPLSPLAFRLFQELGSTAQGSPYILPSRFDKERPMQPGTFTRSLNRNIAKFGIDPFTVHDLRRTARTGLAKLKVNRDIAEMILNHRRGSIIATYDLYFPWGRDERGDEQMGIPSGTTEQTAKETACRHRRHRRNHLRPGPSAAFSSKPEKKTGGHSLKRCGMTPRSRKSMEGIKDLHDSGLCILIVSGRPENYRATTKRWLNKHLPVENYQLFLRKNGDYRPSPLVKKRDY